jgi:sigma-B regulation protein RsbU (phosphoserine phosphatase)
MNAKHQLFGLDRVKTLLEGVVNDSPQAILDKIVEGVMDFVKNAEQSDDLTLLSIRYAPVRFESTLTRTLTIKNDVREVAQFSTFIKTVVEELGIETSLARQIRLAVEEAVVNVIDYAYPVGTEGDVTIRVMSDGKVLHTQIIDTGVAFDPTAMQKADTSLSAEDRKIGGLGILLVREQMDSINYERTDGKNILTLIKKL